MGNTTDGENMDMLFTSTEFGSIFLSQMNEPVEMDDEVLSELYDDEPVTLTLVVNNGKSNI